MKGEVLFTGYYGFDNFGDDLFGLASASGLNYLDGNYSPVILSPPVAGVEAKYLVPKILGGIYKSPGFGGKLLRAFFMIYGCVMYSDVVLAGGSVVSSGSSFRIRYIQYHMARLGFCRLSAVGVSVGPFVSEGDKESARRFINQLSYLTVRDQSSVNECNEMRSNVEPKLYNDLAGCSPLDNVSRAKKTEGGKVLGVSVCRYESITGGNAEVERERNNAIFSGVADFAVKNDICVKIFVLNSNEKLGDCDLSISLCNYLSARGVSVSLKDYVGPVNSLDDIAGCDIFFSVRLHGAISAYLLNVPFLLVEYHCKCKDFLDYIGFDRDNRLLADSVDAAHVAKTLESVLYGGVKVSISPREYIRGARKIFTDSIWAAQ